MLLQNIRIKYVYPSVLSEANTRVTIFPPAVLGRKFHYYV